MSQFLWAAFYNQNEFPKVAQMVKNHPIWSPCIWQKWNAHFNVEDLRLIAKI
jgi:hypothetical protein